MKHRKIFYKNRGVNIHLFGLKTMTLVTKRPTFIYKPYKQFFLVEDLSGNVYNMPGIERVVAGKVFYSPSMFRVISRQFLLKGNCFFLKNLLFSTIFSNVSNLSINRVVFAKAPGTFCRIRKFTKKKKKMILIILPSKNEIYLRYNTLVFIGKNTNFFIKKLVEGKYGNSLYQSKSIEVRGVAKNPVDHPNGGRTKTNKPEKSPWGWVAKFSK